MLFNARINELNAAISNIAATIEQLQIEKQQLENHIQQLSSAEAAAESAVEQIKTTLSMIRAIAPGQESAFGAAINDLFNQNLEPSEEQPPTEPTPDEVITVEVETVEEETREATNGNGHDPLTHLSLQEIGLLTLAQIRKILTLLNDTESANLSTKGNKPQLVQTLSEYGISLSKAETILGINLNNGKG